MDNSGTAFPAQWEEVNPAGTDIVTLRSHGLTKREWFTGMALMGLCSSLDREMGIRDIAKDAADLAQAAIEELGS